VNRTPPAGEESLFGSKARKKGSSARSVLEFAVRPRLPSETKGRNLRLAAKLPGAPAANFKKTNSLVILRILPAFGRPLA
jgi:hypothetical protein